MADPHKHEYKCPVVECSRMIPFNQYWHHLMTHNRRVLAEAIIMLTT